MSYHYSTCYFPSMPKWDKVFCKKHCRTSNIIIITLVSYFSKPCKNYKTIFTKELFNNN